MGYNEIHPYERNTMITKEWSIQYWADQFSSKIAKADKIAKNARKNHYTLTPEDVGSLVAHIEDLAAYATLLQATLADPEPKSKIRKLFRK
jgi:hypothetical protein